MEALSKEEALGTLLEDVRGLLEDLLESGFDTAHDSTLKELLNMTQVSEQYGMTYLSELLKKLADGLNTRRHQVTHKEDDLMQVYTTLNEYLYLCLKKTAYDRGRSYYLENDEK